MAYSDVSGDYDAALDINRIISTVCVSTVALRILNSVQTVPVPGNGS